jgi:hypothetical protein
LLADGSPGRPASRGELGIRPGDVTICPTSPGQMTIRPTSPGDITIRPQTSEGTRRPTLPDEITTISTVVEAISNVSTEAAVDNPVVEAFDHQHPMMAEGRNYQRPHPSTESVNNQHLTVTRSLSPRLPSARPSPTAPATGNKTHLALITEDLDRQIALLGETVEVFRRERDELRRVVEGEKRKKKEKEEGGEEEEQEVSGLHGSMCVLGWLDGVLKWVQE